MLLIHLVDFKWTEDAPFPAYRVLAAGMGISEKQVQRLAKSLERKGYLRREQRGAQSNRFHLDGLFGALEAALTPSEEDTDEMPVP